jgi:ribose/xylose/arabinose/galactoside ABC-type transport system permease subunit
MIAAESGALRRQKTGLILQSWGVYLGLAVLLGVSAAVSPQSFNAQDLLNLAKQASGLGIVAIGQTLVILTGGIDLSVGSIITLVHVFSVGTILGRPELVLPVSLLCLALGLLIGVVNGIGVTRARISPFVMTLCMDFILRGLYMIYTKGQPNGVVPENMRFIGRGRILEVVPIAALIWIGLSLLFVFLLRRTLFGARLYAVGANPRTAWLSGVKNNRIIFLAYAFTGLLAAAAGLILTGDMGAVSLGLGGDYSMDSIAAVVIGGTSFSGGIGGVEGTIAGAFIIRLLTSLLQKANISNPGKLIIQGALILLIVGAYSKRKRT